MFMVWYIVCSTSNMSEQNKLEILAIINKDINPGKPVRFGYNVMSKNLSLTKDKLDVLLVELNKDRFIAQYVKKGVDSFTVMITQKGIDAVQDESFI